MATYTMPLKVLVEQPTQNRDDLTLKQRIEVGRVSLFQDIEYPLFNDIYRREFETKFIRYFYNKEIGFETEGLFKFELETWLQINMPYYNQLFESELLKYDPLTNIAMRVDQNTKADTTENTTQDTTQDSKNNTGVESSFEHDKDRDVLTDSETNTTGMALGTSNTNTTNNVKGKSDTDTTNNVTGESNTDTSQLSDGTANTISDNTGHSETSGDTTQRAFNRQIQSNTPDGRLELTSNEGTGIIEYANSINETLDNSTGTTNTTTDTTDNTTSNTTTHDDVSGNTNTTDSQYTVGTTGTTDSQDTISNSDTTDSQDTTGQVLDVTTTDDTEKTKGWDRSDTTATGEVVGNVIGQNLGNRVEDMFNERYGKEGSVTYQQMVKELRQTFLRIERQMFKEMSELFMLLY